MKQLELCSVLLLWMIKVVFSLCSKLPLKLPNPHIEKMSEDILYHLALGTKTHDLKSMFGDIKVIMHDNKFQIIMMKINVLKMFFNM